MSSNLGCVGLDVPDEAALRDLVLRMLPAGASLGASGSRSVVRCEDPSGARIIVRFDGETIVGFVPSFAGGPGARLDDLIRVGDDLWSASVVDDDGEQLTAMTLELEQGWILGDRQGSTQVVVVALGIDVSVHDDEAAFAESPASLLSPNSGDDSEPPPHYVEMGWKWPPRMAAESFISYGVFALPEEASAHARLNGVVLEVAQHVVEVTGQRFSVARVASVGVEFDVCLAASDHPVPPVPGNVVSGTVFLVGSIEPWSGAPIVGQGHGHA